MFGFLKRLFRDEERAKPFDPNEVNRVTAQNLAAWKSQGWQVPEAPKERPVAGVTVALGPEFAENVIARGETDERNPQ